MSIDRRQSIVGRIKMKDRYLHNEIFSNLVPGIHTVSAQTWDTIYNDTLLPNPYISSKMKDEIGRSFLHHACSNHQTPEYVINFLLDNNPNASKARVDNGENEFPLHMSLTYGQSEAVVLKLLQAFPQAAKHKDRCGRYPLHSVCRYHQFETVVQELIKIYPEATRLKQNRYSLYPLHVACCNFQSETVVQQLIHEHPEAAKHKCDLGDYPLHIACTFGQSETVVEELIRICPDAVKHRGREGLYPHSLALKYSNYSQFTDKVVQKLLEAFPEAEMYKTLRRNRTDLMRK